MLPSNKSDWATIYALTNHTPYLLSFPFIDPPTHTLSPSPNTHRQARTPLPSFPRPSLLKAPVRAVLLLLSS